MSQLIVPTTDDLIEACRLLGYRVCGDHAEISHEHMHVGLLATLDVLVVARINDLPNRHDLKDAFETAGHNVAAMAGLISCDDELHTVRGACCGLVGDS